MIRLRARILLSALCAFLAHSSAFAAEPDKSDTAIPDTPAGKQLSALLHVIDEGDPAKVGQFVADHFSAGALGPHSRRETTQLLLNLHKRAPRGLKVVATGSKGDDGAGADVIGDAPGMMASLRLMVSTSDPSTLVRFAVFKGGPELDRKPYEQAKPGASEADRVRRIEKAMAAAAAADRFSGTIVVAKGDKVLLRKAYGLADKAARVPNTPETKFNLGSMNKMFTSVALAQLVQQGKISYDDPVSKWVPDYPNPEVAAKVRIHHLLTHTSGLGDYFGPEFDRKKGDIHELADYFQFFAKEPLLFEPGKDWAYSNGAMLLAGVIVERASGQDYYAYVREHIYAPAGMRDSDSFAVDEIVPKLAVGYTRRGGLDPLAPDEPQRSNVLTLPPRGGPAGGGYSTVDDLLRFSLALRGGKLVDPKYVELITTGKVQTKFGPDIRYGYGFEDGVENGRRVFGHGGMAPGVCSDLRVFPELGYTVAVMGNYDPATAWELSALAGRILTQP